MTKPVGGTEWRRRKKRRRRSEVEQKRNRKKEKKRKRKNRMESAANHRRSFAQLSDEPFGVYMRRRKPSKGNVEAMISRQRRRLSIPEIETKQDCNSTPVQLKEPVARSKPPISSIPTDTPAVEEPKRSKNFRAMSKR